MSLSRLRINATNEWSLGPEKSSAESSRSNGMKKMTLPYEHQTPSMDSKRELKIGMTEEPPVTPMAHLPLSSDEAVRLASTQSMTPCDEATIDTLDEQSPYQGRQQPSTLSNETLKTHHTAGLHISSECDPWLSGRRMKQRQELSLTIGRLFAQSSR